jgi:hypothetical protein
MSVSRDHVSEITSTAAACGGIYVCERCPYPMGAALHIEHPIHIDLVLRLTADPSKNPGTHKKSFAQKSMYHHLPQGDETSLVQASQEELHHDYGEEGSELVHK